MTHNFPLFGGGFLSTFFNHHHVEHVKDVHVGKGMNDSCTTYVKTAVSRRVRFKHSTKDVATHAVKRVGAARLAVVRNSTEVRAVSSVVHAAPAGVHAAPRVRTCLFTKTCAMQHKCVSLRRVNAVPSEVRICHAGCAR